MTLHSSRNNVLEEARKIQRAMDMGIIESGEMNRLALRATFLIVGGDVAHYVVHDRVTDMLTLPQVEKSVKAMGAAGVLRLPFDRMLLEFNSIGHRGRVFVRLQTKPLVPEREPAPCDVYAYVAFPHTPSGPSVAKQDYLTIDPGTPIRCSFDHERGYTVHRPKHNENASQRKLTELLTIDASQAMLTACMMLDTKGMATECVPAPVALNKQRARQGKPAIQGYSVLRIGHVYDKQGRSHSVEGTGRHMPIHYRAAHVRHVPYGKLARDAEGKLYSPEDRPTRMHLIPPCLVNYVPSEDGPMPQLPTKEVRA